MKKSIGSKTFLPLIPVLIIGSYDEKLKPNLMACAWGGICCSKPPCVNISLRKATLPASCFKQVPETSPLIEVTIPAFIGPDQGKPWVGVLRKLTEVRYY